MKVYDEYAPNNLFLTSNGVLYSDIKGPNNMIDAFKQEDVKHKLDVALTYCLSAQAMKSEEEYYDADSKEDLR